MCKRKVYSLIGSDTFFDWYTGVPLENSETYKGKVFVVGLGWFETGLTGLSARDRFWKYIGR